MTTDRDALGRSRLSQPPKSRPKLLLYSVVAIAGFAGMGIVGTFWWRELIGVILPGAVFFVCLILALAALSKLME